MVAAGSDIIELGVPFSDPMADGPVIQKAGEKALAFGIGLGQVLEMVREFRQQDADTPVVLMGYANPVERYELGMATTASRATRRRRRRRRADRRLSARGVRGFSQPS